VNGGANDSKTVVFVAPTGLLRGVSSLSMGLVEEIRNDAVNPDIPLAVLLRKCLVLASRLDHTPLLEWVQYELGGYPDDVAVPSYRGPHRLAVKANLSGPFQSMVKNVPVPVTAMPEWARDWTPYESREGVAGLEQTLRAAQESGHGSLRVNLPADLALAVDVFRGHSTVEIWMELPLGLGVGILDEVRNKVLGFVLEIERENPSAGEAPIGSQPVRPERVEQIFNYVVMGGVHNWSVGHSGETRQTINLQVKPGDFESLSAFLREQGLEDQEIEELAQVLPEDSLREGDREPGPKTKGWLRKAAKKVAQRVGQVSMATATGVLTAAVNRYLGLT
jgi:AbiTii-like protein